MDLALVILFILFALLALRWFENSSAKLDIMVRAAEGFVVFPTLPDLLAALDHEEDVIKEQAAAVLGLSGKAAVLPLVQRLGSMNSNQRYWAAKALAEMGENGLWGVTQPLLDAKSPSMRDGCLQVLRLLDYDQIRKDTQWRITCVVLSLLEDQDRRMREDAVTTLGCIPTKFAVDKLVEVINGEDSGLARVALIALEYSRAPKKALSDARYSLMSSGEQWKRHHIAKMLASSGELEALAARAISDRDPRVCATACEAIAEAGSGSPEFYSRRILAGLKGALKDKSEEVRTAAVMALGATGNSTVIRNLIPMLEDESQSVRIAAIGSLRHFEADRILPPLIELFDNNDPRTRYEAVTALADYLVTDSNGPTGIDLLIQILDSESELTRIHAACTASRIPGLAERAIPTLIGALRSAEPEVRYLTVTSLAAAVASLPPNYIFESGLPIVELRHTIQPLILEPFESCIPGVRKEAAERFLQFGTESDEAVSILVNSMSKGEGAEQQAVAKCFGRIKKRADQVVAQLNRLHLEGDTGTRNAVLEAFKAMGPLAKDGVNTLLKSLKSSDEIERKHAAEALGEVGSKEAVEELNEVLTADDEELRFTAAIALTKIDVSSSMKVVPILLRVLRKEVRPTLFGIGKAAVAIARLGPNATYVEAAVPTLLEIIQQENENITFDIEAAAMALGKLKVTSAIEPLTMLLRRKKDCDAAIKALWYIGTPKSQELALEAVKRNIKGQPIREAMRAAKTLATFASEEDKAYETLAALIDDEDIVVRCVAVETISLLGHRALPALQTALKEVDDKQDPATTQPSPETYGKSFRDFVSSAILRLGAALEEGEGAPA